MRLAQRGVLAVALVGPMLLAHAPCAHAAGVRNGVLGMSPAHRELVARPPVNLSPTRAANSTQVPIAVKTYPVILTQNLDGSFGFLDSARALNAAKLIFPVGPSRYVLQPGEARELSLRWNLVRRGKKAAYMGLVVEGTPQLKSTTVNQILRLLGTNFFVLPGHWKVTGRLTQVTGEQAAPRILRFKPRIRNTGQVHSTPRGGACVVRAVDGSGTRVRLRFRGQVILPGYAVEFPVVLRRPLLPAGAYAIDCSARFGSRRSHATLGFKLSGPNTLPTPDLRLKALSAKGEIGAAAHVKVTYTNVGTKSSPAVLKVTLARAGRGGLGATVARKVARQAAIGPKSARTVEVDLGTLAKGSYRATVVLSTGAADVDRLSSDFVATMHKGLLTRLGDWLRDHIAWLLALLALILLVLVVWWTRRRQRRLEEELEAARAGDRGGDATRTVAPVPPVPPAPVAADPDRAGRVPTTAPETVPARAAEARIAPAPLSSPPPAPQPVEAPAREPVATAAAPAVAGRVNVNTGGVEELMQLPGVGRRAAERLVAYREANGGFESLQDLRNVEGFHEERIRRISETAEL